jgi:hypothetical protein
MCKKYLLGVFEIGIFMKDGVNRFGKGFPDLWCSFGIVLLSLPLILASVPYVYNAQEELQSISLNIVALLFGGKFFVSLGLQIGFSYIVCKVLQIPQKFIHYVTVSNWATIIPTLFYLPILYTLSQGFQNYDSVYPYLVFISIYSYALGAFITKYVLGIPWELAIFIAICAMAISEGCYKLLFFVANMV